MAVTKKKTTTSAGKSRVTKQRAVESIFEADGLPGWLGWGTMGAESTYGTDGNYAFGGIDLPNSGNGNWVIEAKESAKAYKRLVQQYGSVPAAVPHYSGNSYTVGHIEELSKGGGSQGAETGVARFTTNNKGETQLAGLFGIPFLGEGDLGIPGFGELFGEGHEKGKLPGESQLGPTEQLGEAAQAPLAGFEQAAAAVTAFLSMLTNVQFWIRVGEAIGAMILIYMGLHSLTGAGPTPSSVAASKGI